MMRASKPKGKPTLAALYIAQMWQCRHRADCSEIVTRAGSSDTWETIATIHPATGASAKDLATLIVTVVNQHRQSRDLLRDATETLEIVMKEGLTYSTEQEIERLISGIGGRGI
jgi:hypothetical protein